MKQNGRPGAGRRLALPLSASGMVCLWAALNGCTTNEYPGNASHAGGGASTSKPNVSGGAAGLGAAGGGAITTTAAEASGGVSSPASGGSSPAEIGGQNGIAGSTNEVCSAGLSSCPGEPACTTNLSTGTMSGATFKNCGSCAITCSLANASGATCAAGKCVTACVTGYGECDVGALNDGCESNLQLSAAACGSCGRTCSSAGALTVACTNAICTPSCDQKHADCNPDLGTGTDDGCEVYLDQLTRCGTNCVNGLVCPANQVCNAGVCGAAQGVVALTVPLSASGQNQRYADKLPALPNLTDADVVVRIYAPGATAGALAVYVQDQNYVSGGWTSFPLTTLSNGWSDITVKAGPAAGSYDPKHINQITLEVMADGSGPWASPTVVYVDSIRSSNGVLNDTFDASIGGFVSSGMQIVQGSKLEWAGSLPAPPTP